MFKLEKVLNLLTHYIPPFSVLATIEIIMIKAYRLHKPLSTYESNYRVSVSQAFCFYSIRAKLKLFPLHEYKVPDQNGAENLFISPL